MHTFPRPKELHLTVPREPVDAECPECGGRDIAAYRVLSEGGWWRAVKCQDCLASLSREPDDPYGSIVPLGSTV